MLGVALDEERLREHVLLLDNLPEELLLVAEGAVALLLEDGVADPDDVRIGDWLPVEAAAVNRGDVALALRELEDRQRSGLEDVPGADVGEFSSDIGPREMVRAEPEECRLVRVVVVGEDIAPPHAAHGEEGLRGLHLKRVREAAEILLRALRGEEADAELQVVLQHHARDAGPPVRPQGYGKAQGLPAADILHDRGEAAHHLLQPRAADADGIDFHHAGEPLPGLSAVHLSDNGALGLRDGVALADEVKPDGAGGLRLELLPAERGHDEGIMVGAAPVKDKGVAEVRVARPPLP